MIMNKNFDFKLNMDPLSKLAPDYGSLIEPFRHVKPMAEQIYEKQVFNEINKLTIEKQMAEKRLKETKNKLKFIDESIKKRLQLTAFLWILMIGITVPQTLLFFKDALPFEVIYITSIITFLFSMLKIIFYFKKEF